MCSIGAGNQAADVFKSIASHYPSDSDDESDSSALEDVKSPSDSLSFEAVVETAAAESSAKVCGGQALPVVPGLRRLRFEPGGGAYIE
jgi:hypothetical protein